MAYFHRGMNWSNTGKENEYALSDIGKALEIYPLFVHAYIILWKDIALNPCRLIWKRSKRAERKQKNEALRLAKEEEYKRADKERKTPAPDITNSVGMMFVKIPAGTFIIGSPKDEPGRRDSETQYQVTISKPFYMQTTEVTQDHWKAVMGGNPSSFKDGGDNCPVETVSWGDVQEFIKKLNQKGEGTYRLPTEAEWEYAARAGSTTAFADGEITETGCGNAPNLTKMGWYCGNAGGKPHEVGQKSPNAWGLYDMHGNVWEWRQDWKGDYPSGAVTDPVGPSSGSYRVLRGGGWGSSAGNCRTAHRHSYSPGNRNSLNGFRLVLPSGQ